MAGQRKMVSGHFIIITYHYYAGLNQTREEPVYIMAFAWFEVQNKDDLSST